MIHDPHHVAHLAATILSARPEPETHHIKTAVASARAVLDEAHRMANEDEARAKFADAPAAEGAVAENQP